MPYYFFNWNETNQEHLAQHDVSPEVFEQLVCGPHRVEESRSSDRQIAFSRN